MKITSYKKDGKTYYKFCAYIGLSANGKQKQIRRQGFKTKKEAEMCYAKIKMQSNSHMNADITFKKLSELWLSNYKNTVKGATYRRTSMTIFSHLNPVFGSKKIDKIKPSHVQQFVNEKYAEYVGGHKIVSLLKTIFTYAVKMDMLEKNPFNKVMLPKRKVSEKRVDNFYDKKELKEFLKLAKIHMDKKWYTFFYLLAFTGMRRGEALALAWENVDLENATINVVASVSRDANNDAIIGTTKTKSSTRLIDLDSSTINLLKEWRMEKPDSYFVFENTKGSFTTPSQPVRKMDSFCKKTGFRYISPHGFRHTHCSMLFAAGVPLPQVQARLGHTDIHTTINIYNHVYKEDKKEAVEKFSNYINS